MSLSGLLVIIVVLGGLAAAAIVGVNAMTGSDTSTLGPATSTSVRPGGGGTSRVGSGGVISAAVIAACNAAATAANTASSAYFASSGGAYPTTWSEMTASSGFALPDGVVVSPKNPAQLDANGWRLTMSGGGNTAPAFGCSYPRP